MAALAPLEKAELVAIPVATGLIWFLPLGPQFTLKVGAIITAASLLLLLQGFCRDVWLWFELRRAVNPPPPRYAQCMCVESAVGFTGVVAAAGLTGFGFGPPIALSQVAITGGAALVMVGGFLLKDFVFEWSPWRIYREKDHARVHFRWRK